MAIFGRFFVLWPSLPELDPLECPAPWWENPCIPQNAWENGIFAELGCPVGHIFTYI